MAMTFDEFRAALLDPAHRAALGIELSESDAHLVHADAASSQSWYEYWLSTQTAPAPPAPVLGDAPPAYRAPDAFAAPSPAAPFATVGPATAAHLGGTAPDGGMAYPGAPGLQTAVFDGASVSPDLAPEAPRRKRRTGLWVTLSILLALVLVAAAVVAYAFISARHWTKTDVAEQPETFHSETYQTGRYDVTMDSSSPCSVDQDWTDCTNLMAAQYDGACAGVTLTETATLLCTDYLAEVNRMRAEDTGDFVVASLGSYGNLQRTEEMDTREVSNDDYEPAVTHEAVCYLEFIGECE